MVSAGEKGIPTQGLWMVIGFTIVYWVASEGLTDKVRYLSKDLEAMKA